MQVDHFCTNVILFVANKKILINIKVTYHPYTHMILGNVGWHFQSLEFLKLGHFRPPKRCVDMVKNM